SGGVEFRDLPVGEAPLACCERNQVLHTSSQTASVRGAVIPEVHVHVAAHRGHMHVRGEIEDGVGPSPRALELARLLAIGLKLLADGGSSRLELRPCSLLLACVKGESDDLNIVPSRLIVAPFGLGSSK